MRSLGRDVDINGQTVSLKLNQLYAEQKKFLLLEIETPVLEAEQDQLIAEATAKFRSIESEQVISTTTRSVARVIADKARVENSLNKPVMIAAIDFIGNERNLAATALRDQGKIEESKAAFNLNCIDIQAWGTKLDSAYLLQEAGYNRDDAEKVDTPAWRFKRKAIQQRANSKISQNPGYRSQD